MSVARIWSEKFYFRSKVIIMKNAGNNMATSTKDLIKRLMKKLDLLHTKYVHVWVNQS